MSDKLDLLIVGAGFAGLYMLIKARRQGLRALVLEAAGGIGGTWYHNRYPGARVDVQSVEYSFSFDDEMQQQWQWSERYSPQGELLRYANHVADRFALRDGIRLNTRVVAANYDEDAASWHVRSEGGECWSARFLVMASGPLSLPNQPAFEGMRDFHGSIFHTARWPEECIDFSGQRVAVIGTGSSGVQSIPLIAQQARELTVFQRTAAYAVPAHNGALDAAYAARIKADYPAFRQRNLRMSTGFGSELPPSRQSALDATPEELEAAFEERWRIGGFGLLGAFHDILLDEEANALAAEFVRG
ncbi:MAG: NAD(P)/FAD-dependent oxidoreductase, partial [Rubrivivax sp.]